MKRNAKIKVRLTLNRETLRNLDSAEMSNAQGGAYTTILTGCPVRSQPCITQVTCPSNCVNTCPVAGPVISLISQ